MDSDVRCIFIWFAFLGVYLYDLQFYLVLVWIDTKYTLLWLWGIGLIELYCWIEVFLDENACTGIEENWSRNSARVWKNRKFNATHWVIVHGMVNWRSIQNFGQKLKVLMKLVRCIANRDNSLGGDAPRWRDWRFLYLSYELFIYLWENCLLHRES